MQSIDNHAFNSATDLRSAKSGSRNFQVGQRDDRWAKLSGFVFVVLSRAGQGRLNAKTKLARSEPGVVTWVMQMRRITERSEGYERGELRQSSFDDALRPTEEGPEIIQAGQIQERITAT